MMRTVLIILYFMVLFTASCSQGYIVNMKQNTAYPEGRNLFVSKCNACHQLYSPDRLTESAWDSVLIPMQEKAKINSEQRNAIYHWIIEIKKISVNSTGSK